MIWLSIIILLLVLLVGLFSVVGLHGGVSDTMIILSIFQPVRFRSNAFVGIKQLMRLNEELTNKEERVEGGKVGVVNKGDKGFDELLKVIKDNCGLEGKFIKILLVEHPAVIERPGVSASVERFLALETNGEHEIIPADPFDANKPIRELKDWIEDEYRKQLAYWMLVVLVIWLLANSALIYLLNR